MRFFTRKQKETDHIVIKKFAPPKSRTCIHNQISASITFDNTKIIRSFTYNTEYKAQTKKTTKLALRTTSAHIWDGVGGAIFFAQKETEIHEKAQKEMLLMTQARLKDFTSTLSKYRTTKRVLKSHASLYNDRTTVRYNFGRYISKPFTLNECIYNETTPAVYIKGVDTVELLNVARLLFQSRTYFDVLLVNDFNNRTFYELSPFAEKSNMQHKRVKELKTLVLHPYDPAFAGYKELYSDKRHTLITAHDLPFKKLVTALKHHDHIMIIGRGKGNLLINPYYTKNSRDLNPYIINRAMLVFLEGKKVTRLRKPCKNKN